MKKLKGNFAFIDSQNLYLGVKSQGWMLDYKKFRVYLKDKYNVTKAYMFIGYKAGNEQLYRQMQEDGYVVIFKPTLEMKKGKKVVVKGNVDAEMVLHAMIEYRRYDKSIIVSGDGDFHCLIEHLASKNKLEKVIVPNKRHSSLLRKYSSYILNIALVKHKLMKKS